MSAETEETQECNTILSTTRYNKQDDDGAPIVVPTDIQVVATDFPSINTEDKAHDKSSTELSRPAVGTPVALFELGLL